jgi:hypothetical protein
MGRLYFSDLLGAATGCLLAVSLIEAQGVPGLIIIASGLLFAAAAALGVGIGRGVSSAALGTVAVAVLGLAAPAGERIPIAVTSTKHPPSLHPKLGDGESYIRWTALSRVDAAGWDRPTRRAFWATNGLMRGFPGPLPQVARVTYDGSNGSNIYPYSGDLSEYAMLEHHLLRTPYLLTVKPRVLVIGVGGGIDMINAIVQGASHVTGAELQPQTVYLLKDRLREFTGGFYDRPDVELIASEGRHFIRKTEKRFDLIQITATDTFAAQATGAYVLAESYLYTVEAVADYLTRLEDDGVLSMVMGDLVHRNDTPPPLGTRIASIAWQALSESGADRPADHLLIIGSLNREGTARVEEILVKKSPLTRPEVSAVLAFTAAKGFEVLYAPERFSGGREHWLGPVLGDDAAVRERALDTAWFRMDPVRDGDPFFYNVGRWSHFGSRASIYFMFPGSSVGQLMLVLMLVQSGAWGVVLIGLPLLRGAREGLRGPRVASYLAYFLALGIGFMFVEISFVQSFVLFLGSPTHALSVTIFSLLLFSSLGSLLSARVADRPEWALRRVAPVVTVLIVLYALGLSRVFDYFLPLEFPARLAIAVAAQLPMGLTLGAFMPLGIACIAREQPRLVPWAWGINGIGSVVGTTLAVVIAMAWGFAAVAAAAATLYALGTFVMTRGER